MNDKIKQLIEATATEIAELARAEAHENAMAALQSVFGQANGRVGRGRPKATVSRRGGARRGRPRAASSEKDAEAILAFLKTNPDSGRAAIQKEIKITNTRFTQAIKALGKSVKKKGVKRGTTYSAK